MDSGSPPSESAAATASTLSILATIEETGEMSAAVLFLSAFLEHLSGRTDRVVVRLG